MADLDADLALAIRLQEEEEENARKAAAQSSSTTRAPPISTRDGIEVIDLDAEDDAPSNNAHNHNNHIDADAQLARQLQEEEGKLP